MLSNLKERVCKANKDLVKFGLVALTWGNVSGLDRNNGLVVIKPSGLSYENMKPSDMVVVDLNGKVVEGQLNPSSDTPTHIALYRAFGEVSGVVHSHSEYAAMFAQALKEIPCLGTTHADYFNGQIPLTRMITEREVKEDYEGNTGMVIVERFFDLEPMEMPATLVPGHGAFSWGKSPGEAVIHSLILEKVAKMAWGTICLAPHDNRFPEYLLKKHYHRKHGPDAYYGQKKKEIR